MTAVGRVCGFTGSGPRNLTIEINRRGNGWVARCLQANSGKRLLSAGMERKAQARCKMKQTCCSALTH